MEEAFLSPRGVERFWNTRRDNGVPSSYSVLPRGIENIRYDTNGFASLFWENERISFISTPGHGQNAISIIVARDGRQVVFCGDAAYAGATIWQPYHLEWNHWTGSGALSAWEGIERLPNIGIDLLCPSHGPVISDKPRAMLKKLSSRLMDFYHAKGSICPGERDNYIRPKHLKCGAHQVLENLYQFGANAYLLTSKNSQGLIVDFLDQTDSRFIGPLLGELGVSGVSAALVTHYHNDHSGGLAYLKEHYGAQSWLHPLVAKPLRKIGAIDAPWLPKRPILPDHRWPMEGNWRWNEYVFKIAHMSGQTWWHCGFMTDIDGEKVLFGGDNFQPNSRWNGTGGGGVLLDQRQPIPRGFPSHRPADYPLAARHHRKRTRNIFQIPTQPVPKDHRLVEKGPKVHRGPVPHRRPGKRLLPAPC